MFFSYQSIVLNDFNSVVLKIIVSFLYDLCYILYETHFHKCMLKMQTIKLEVKLLSRRKFAFFYIQVPIY